MPLSYQNPCYIEDKGEATHMMLGTNPNGHGGGVLFWAYSEHEAQRMLFEAKGKGYKNLSIRPSDQNTTVDEIFGLAFGEED